MARIRRYYSRTDAQANAERTGPLVPISKEWVDAEAQRAKESWEWHGRPVPLEIYTARWMANALGFIVRD